MDQIRDVAIESVFNALYPELKAKFPALSFTGEKRNESIDKRTTVLVTYLMVPIVSLYVVETDLIIREEYFYAGGYKAPDYVEPETHIPLADPQCFEKVFKTIKEICDKRSFPTELRG
jgi:hypothetical protein